MSNSKVAFDSEAKSRWRFLVTDRERREREALLARLREQQLQDLIKQIEDAKLSAWLDIGSGSLSIGLFILFPPTTEVGLVLALSSTAFALDQTVGGARTLLSIQNHVFDPNKEYKIVRGFLIDVGSDATFIYDLSNIGVGLLSARGGLQDIKDIRNVGSIIIMGDELKMILKKVDIGNDISDTMRNGYQMTLKK